jgi:predicted porin
MRKLLLATVAALGASLGVSAVAEAQTASPAPGTVTVRLNGRFRAYAFYTTDRDVDNNTSGVTGGTATTGANKQANYGIAEYARLYPGFDGVAANGLKYGASLEIRQDNNSAAGGGLYGGVSQQNRSRGNLYLRREWGYLGTDQLGTIRVGSTDQPSSLYMTGNFENFNDGGLNGDTPAFISSNAVVTWPFADVGNYYTTSKVVYLSPQLFGFDAGVSWEPSTANVSGDGGNGCGGASYEGSSFVPGASGGISGPGCNRLSSTSINAESARRRNTFDGLLRYRGSFGGFGIAATAGYIGGSNVKDDSGLPFNNNASIAGLRPNYEGLSAGDFGLAVTYGGLSVGGKYMFGRYNGQLGILVPKGFADGESALVGASYTIGPVIVGAHGLYNKSAGDLGNANFGRQRTELGIGAGGTYSLAPGVSLYLSYLYNERKQNGYNFLTGAGVTAGNAAGTTANNKVTSQLISLGTAFSW